MKKQTKMACLILAFAAVISGCKKNEMPGSGSGVSVKKSINSGGDGKWDLLGYGLDVTRDLLDPSGVSDVAIFDMARFENDFRSRIDVNGTTEGTEKYYSGASAMDYMKDVSKQNSFGISGNATLKELNFTGSLTRNSSDQNTIAYSSRYSYATYEVRHKIKRVRFTGDVSLESLMQYLTPEFVNNVATQSADDLVKRYGTHVMLDISIGGRLRFNYSGFMANASDTQKKTRGVKAGLGFSVLKVIGVNLTADMSKEEVTKLTTETRNKEYTGKYYGGTNSGRSISIDKDGNTSENINIASWQQSVNDRNAALIDVGRAVFLYDFIADPVKKGQVKAAVEKHIKDSQKEESGEVPVYRFLHDAIGDYAYTINPNDYAYAQNGWRSLGTIFYAWPTQKQETTPVHLLINYSQGIHILTANRYAWPYEQNGFTYIGVAFYAYLKQVSGTVPVYSLYNAKINKHAYTTDLNEYNNWQNFGIGFYAAPN